MILDNQALLSDAQALTLAALTPSTNTFDFGKMGVAAYNKAQLRRRKGKDHTPLLIQVVEDFAGAVTSINIKVQSSDSETFASGVKDVISFDTPVAELVAGFIFPVDELPRGIDARYLRLAYTMNNTATAGKITSGVVGAVDGGYYGNK